MQGVVVACTKCATSCVRTTVAHTVLLWQRAARIIRRSTDCIMPRRALIAVAVSVEEILICEFRRAMSDTHYAGKSVATAS